jgi:hypothetical protein
VRRWPLVLIALPAAVAVWSGWVGLGGMCGFGVVQPFPGIVPWHLNTAITLPVGVEAYGAYALGAWLTPGTPRAARTFARRSAIGALALGMLGQVVYHLLAAAHAARAPWPVVVLIACLPVVTLGFGAGLTHLLRVPDADDHASPADDAAAPGAVPVTAPVPDVLEMARALTDAYIGNAPESTAMEPAATTPGADPADDAAPVPTSNEHAAELAFRATHAAGNPLSVRKLQDRFGLTRGQATKVRNRVIDEPSDGQADEPGGYAIPADAEPVADDAPEPVAV